MNKHRAMRVFGEVARRGGFAVAGRALNLSTPSVSRLISDLEQDLGVRLFQRSTRKVSLTEEGEMLLRRGTPLLEEFEAVSEEIRNRQSVPRGHLRVSCVVAFGQERIAPALPGFMARYPGVSVELEVSNRVADLVQDHVDVAIRIGGPDGLEVSSLKARHIYSQKLIFVAAPGYVAEYGAPTDLSDLGAHRVVKQISGNWGRVNEFRKGLAEVSFSLPETLVVNSPIANRNIILSGQAMGLLADYLAADLITNGDLTRLLPEYETVDEPIYAVFVHRHYMPAKVRAFLDYLVETLGARPQV
jgi:DNA-binding transcriptional LysR family regulator